MMEDNTENILNKIQKSRLGRIAIFIVCMAILFASYLPVVNSLKQKNEYNKIKSMKFDTDSNILTSVEHVTKSNNRLEFVGWALRLNSANTDVQLVLQPVDGSEIIVLETELEERKEIANYFVPGWDFGMCGFNAKIKEKKLEENACYEILLVLGYKYGKDEGVKVREYTKKVSTFQYLYNGELYKYNPQNFVPPVVTDVEIQQVILNGNLLAFDREKEIWIYEYEGRMYWMIDFSLFGNAENRPEIPMFSYKSDAKKTAEDMFEMKRIYEGYYISAIDYQTYSEDDLYIYSRPVELDDVFIINTGVYNNAGENKGWVWETDIKLDLDIK